MGLKGISERISPDLLHTLASMGHGDEIVLADANFPTASVCRAGPREVRSDGHRITDLLKAILPLFPLDIYEQPVHVMKVELQDAAEGEPPVWKEYRDIIASYADNQLKLKQVPRFDFYEHSKRAYAVVHTGETTKYGNIILKKGLVPAGNK